MHRNVAGFAYLSLIGTALAFVLWFNGIRRLPAAAPPLLGLAAPVTGAVLGWAILGQSLSPLQLTGFVVTLAAIGYGASLRASVPGALPVRRARARFWARIVSPAFLGAQRPGFENVRARMHGRAPLERVVRRECRDPRYGAVISDGRERAMARRGDANGPHGDGARGRSPGEISS